jgi:DNA-directed RNA polymerase specialized sigma24 family protein
MVRELIGAALATLAPRARAALRLHLVERASLDEVARASAVPSTTAVRWIERARDDLGRACRRVARERFQLTTEELEALFDAVEHRLELHLPRML